jgi:tRNA A37 threonylcarbamoyltransferase TsaD
MTETILNTILNEMSNAQEVITGGISKKEYVMNKIKQCMDKDDYERYEPMISLIIDFIKYLATNKKLLDTIKNKKCLSCIK